MISSTTIRVVRARPLSPECSFQREISRGGITAHANAPSTLKTVPVTSPVFSPYPFASANSAATIADPSHTKVSQSAAGPITAISISSRSQVCPLDLGVLPQGGGLVGEGHGAGLEHVGTRGDVEGEVRVLLHQQDRRSLLVDLRDRLVDALDEDRRDSHRRLVEQQQRRLAHH